MWVALTSIHGCGRAASRTCKVNLGTGGGWTRGAGIALGGHLADTWLKQTCLGMDLLSYISAICKKEKPY